MNFFGREDLLQRLQDLWGKRVSSLITCRGRRRIGKSTLIERFAKQSRARFIKIEGMKPEEHTTKEDELDSFASQLSSQTDAESSRPADWLRAFIRLSKEIRGREKTVVLLDEVSWMAYGDPSFAATLKIAWDNYFKKHDRLILVVCGSVSAWIKENIIENGAFYGRRSLDIVVPELPLNECVKFWGDAAERVAVRDIVDVLSVTGGVPRYLEELNPGLSAVENIRKMCFLPKAPLRVDFDDMFTDVITKQYRFSAQILRCLVDGLFFRILGKGRQLPVSGVAEKDILAVSEGREDCSLFVSAKVDGARCEVRIYGLDICADLPEAKALLDGVLQFAIILR